MKTKTFIFGRDGLFLDAFKLSDKVKFFDSLDDLSGCCNRFCQEIQLATLFVAMKEVRDND